MPRRFCATGSGVLDERLEGRDYVAGDFFSIADMAIWPWACLWKNQEQDISDCPNLQAWLDRCYARPGVKAGRDVEKDARSRLQDNDAAKKVLFGQRRRRKA